MANDWGLWVIWAGLIILTTMYAATVVQALRGSKYTFVYIVGGVGFFQALLSIPGQLWPYIWIVANPAFFVQFWLLAVKYTRTANEIPYIVTG